jgi:ketosteroid isomerase-like protein
MTRRLHIPILLRIHRTMFAVVVYAATPFVPITSATTVRTDPDKASAVAEIRSLLRAQEAAWNRGDIDAFMAGYARSGSTIFISQGEVRRGWKAVRTRYRKKYSDRAKMGTLTFSDLDITPLSRDSAVAIGRWQLKRAEDQPYGRFTLIVKRLPEGWRIVLDHTSAASPAK